MDRRTFLSTSLLAGASVSAVAADESAPAPLPPSYSIVDTHVHFWDPANLRYPWLDKSTLLNRPCLPTDYTEAIAPLQVGQIVFVQAACIEEQHMDEVDWVTQLAKKDDRIAAIVASAPLELGDGVLPTLEKMAANPLLRGIRRMLQGEKDPEFCLQDDFVRGVQLLERVKFSFDLGVRRDQLPAVTELVRRCPGVQFMLNHIGVPNIRESKLDPWREHIRTLADLPNIYCKLSGATTVADHANWTRDDLRPAIDHVLECFGFQRVAFGSDWPVMLIATTFPRWVETVSWVLRDRTEAERQGVFRDNAIRFYRLPD
ncbi:MAG: amidohydrolase family protein [bacterium]|nr:amidohydrolase family protein [bacterium]